jgi:2-polyprenyl-3-methyl-5-hydroxy-6-metoxy-1,4-benzoquinol methylase
MAFEATILGRYSVNYLKCQVCESLQRGKFLDSGGGAGVLCRMVRDHGFDTHVSDKHADPLFARAFSLPIGECRTGDFALVSAVEVLEHFEDPAGEPRDCTRATRRAAIGTTE